MTARFHGRTPLFAVPLAAIALLAFARPGILTSGPIDDPNGHPPPGPSRGSETAARETHQNDVTRRPAGRSVVQAAYLLDQRDSSGSVRRSFSQRASEFDDPIDLPPLTGRLQLVSHSEPITIDKPVGIRRQVNGQDAVGASGVVSWSDSIRGLNGIDGLLQDHEVAPLVEIPTIDFVPMAERPWTTTQDLPSPIRALKEPIQPSVTPVRESIVDRSALTDAVASQPDTPDYSRSLLRRFWSRFHVETAASEHDHHRSNQQQTVQSDSDSNDVAPERPSFFPFVLGVPSQSSPSLDDGLLTAGLLDANWYEAERRDAARYDVERPIIGSSFDLLFGSALTGSPMESVPLAKVTETPVEAPSNSSLLQWARRSQASDNDPASGLQEEVNQLAMDWMPGTPSVESKQPAMSDSLLQRILRRRQTGQPAAPEAVAVSEAEAPLESSTPLEANTIEPEPIAMTVAVETIAVEAPRATNSHSDSLLRRMFGRNKSEAKESAGDAFELPPIPEIPSDTVAANPVAESNGTASDGFSDSLFRRAFGARQRRKETSEAPDESPEPVMLADGRADQVVAPDQVVVPDPRDAAESNTKHSIFDVIWASMDQPVETEQPSADGYSDSLVQRVLRRNDRVEPAAESTEVAMASTGTKPSRIAENDDPYSDSLIKRLAGSRSQPATKPEWNTWAVENPDRYSDSLVKRVLPQKATAPSLPTPPEQIALQDPSNETIDSIDGSSSGDAIAVTSPSTEAESQIALPPIPEKMEASVASTRQAPEQEEAEALPPSILADDSELSEPSSALAEDGLDLAPPLFDDLVQESIVINQMPKTACYPAWHPKSWFKWSQCRGINDCGCEVATGGIGRERVMHAPFEVDTTQPMNQYRFGLDLAYNHQSPNRAEYLWASPILGPTQQEVAADYQDFRFMFELGTEWLSVATEIPIRGMNPIVNPNHAGLGDMNITTKTRLLNGEKWQLTQILRTHLNTGSAAMGLGTGHVSMEPGFLARYKINDSNYLHGSIKYWVPIGGTPVFAGEVLNTGIAWSYLQIDRDDVALIHVAEFVNWIVAQGQETIPGVGDASVDGDTIYNLYLGTRLVHDPGGDLGLVEYGVNWGTSLSQTRWYENLLRFEARFSY